MFAVLILLLLLLVATNRKQIFLGDTLCSAGVEGDMLRVEALDWDQTVAVLGSFAGERWVPFAAWRNSCHGIARVFRETPVHRRCSSNL